jgi:hypothetical protein
MNLNYRTIPILAVGFTRSTSPFSRAIQLFRGILGDKSAPNHAFLVTSDHGQLFATEETAFGLEERSMERYTKPSDRIVAMYFWRGFDDRTATNAAQRYLAEIRRRAGEAAKYDFKGLLSFVPLVNKFVKPDPKRQWCSENCASVMQGFGAKFIKDIHVSPDQLLKIMRDSGECQAVLNYYL